MNLREAARGKPCLVRVPGYCNFNPETTVLAHYRMIGVSGIGMKSPDLFGAWCCSDCHDIVDFRKRTHFTRDETKLLLLEGVLRTQGELMKLGMLPA
jgi:hypothetical protein